MSTEQLRAEFEAWCETRSMEVGRDIEGDYISLETALSWEAYQAGRAALQSHPIAPAARELALWAYDEVGADPELTPGLAQLLQHFGISDDAPAALQSQNADAGLDVEAVLRLFLTGDGFIAECDIPHIVAALQSQDREDALRYRALVASGHFVPAPSPYFSIWGLRTTGGKASKAELDEAIDHARRVEGDK